MKKWFGDLRLAHKLGVGFGITIVMMLGIIGFAIHGVGELRSRIHTLSEKSLGRQVELTHFSYAIGNARLLQYRVAGKHGEATNKIDSQVTDYISKADTALSDYDRQVTEPEERKAIESVKTDWSHYKQIWSSIHDKVVNHTTDEAYAVLESKTVETYRNELIPDLDKVFSLGEARGKESAHEGDVTSGSVQQVITAVGALAILTAVMFGWIITKSITAPLSTLADRLNAITENCLAQLTDGLQAFADGDLRFNAQPSTTPVPNVSKDEVGKIAETFNKALSKLQSSIGSYNHARESLAAIVRKLEDSAKSVADTSQGLAASAEESGASSGEIAGGSEKLAKDATSAASVMEELAALIGNSRDGVRIHSEGVASAAVEMSNVAKEGNAAVTDTVAAMARIQQQVANSAFKVQELDAKGKEIGRIVQSIEDIAGQTNLLALNAAIEAARAGEHGRGFAVVADEVRKLAEKATLATQDISSLISGITTTVAQTVESIDSTFVEVEAGTLKTAASGQVLVRIMEASAHVVVQCREMASGSEQVCSQMATGANDVLVSIASVAAISEQSAAGAEELSAGIQEVGAAANELSQMSEDLQNLVNQFKVADERANPSIRLAA
jgi:methyl-accepting chemotaxis protein